MKIKETLLSVKDSVSVTAHSAGLKIEKHSPELLLAAGIVGFVGTVVLACRATVKAGEVLDTHKENMDQIKKAFEIASLTDEEKYTDEDAKQDKVIIYSKTVVGFAKLYAPAIALGGLSIAAILVSRNILNKRYLGAVAAYNGVSAAFREYRQRVIDEQGEIMDRHYRYGTELETIQTTIVDENGKKKKVEAVVEKPADPNNIKNDCDLVVLTKENCSIFDEGNRDLMINSIKAQQSLATTILTTRGHIFLNEVLDALGCDHTPEGCVVGWKFKSPGDQGYVDFGLLKNKEHVADFTERRIDYLVLEFNHDGVIWDKI